MKKFLKIFDDSGKLIRFCAPIFAVAASVLCLIWGITLIASTIQNVFPGLLVIVFGTGAAWLLAFMIDGFGKLVQVGEKLLPGEDSLETFIPMLVDNEPIDDVVICSTCGCPNKAGAAYCISCGTAISTDGADDEYNDYSEADSYDVENDPELYDNDAPVYDEEPVEEAYEKTGDAHAEELFEEPAPYEEEEEVFEAPRDREPHNEFIGGRRPVRGVERPASSRPRVQRPGSDQRSTRGRTRRP